MTKLSLLLPPYGIFFLFNKYVSEGKCATLVSHLSLKLTSLFFPLTREGSSKNLGETVVELSSSIKPSFDTKEAYFPFLKKKKKKAPCKRSKNPVRIAGKTRRRTRRRRKAGEATVGSRGPWRLVLPWPRVPWSGVTTRVPHLWLPAGPERRTRWD